MAAEVTGATVQGTNPSGVPFVQGSDNLIKISISDPINLNLETFKNNVLPYLDGDNNVVSVEITGTEVCLTNIELDTGNRLKVTKKTVDGYETFYVQLPYALDGSIESLEYYPGYTYNQMKVTYNTEDSTGTGIQEVVNYNVTSSDGIITSIVRSGN